MSSYLCGSGRGKCPFPTAREINGKYSPRMLIPLSDCQVVGTNADTCYELTPVLPSLDAAWRCCRQSRRLRGVTSGDGLPQSIYGLCLSGVIIMRCSIACVRQPSSGWCLLEAVAWRRTTHGSMGIGPPHIQYRF